MKAMVLHRFGEPLRMETVKDPEPGPREALVRVKACGVCGTDVKISSGFIAGVPLPHIMGHEIAGEVVQVGNEVEETRAGDRVCVHFYLTCGKCVYCQTGRESICSSLIGRLGFELDGGFAEFVRAPERNLIKIGRDLSYEEASVLADSAATAFHALTKRAQITPGKQVVIWGSGGVGFAAIQVAKLCGARVIALDVDDKKLEMAKKLGADEVVNVRKGDTVQAVNEFTRGKGVDVVLDLVGHQETVDGAVNVLRRGGKLIFVGYDPKNPFRADSHDMVLRELEIVGSRASSRQELKELVDLVEEKKVRAVVSETLPMAEVNEVLSRLKKGEVVGRIVLKP